MNVKKNRVHCQKIRPPYGGSDMRADMVTAVPVGTAGRQATKGDKSPFNPLTKCSSVIVVDAHF